MKKYLQVNLIEAEQSNLETAFKYLRWPIPSSEYPLQEGYLIKYEDGFESWCHKEKFEKANNREIIALTFGHAIEAVKQGKKIAREGWNGKGMFVYYIPANKYPFSTEAGKSLADEEGKVSYNAYLAIKNVNGTVSTWVPSINDVLAEDWTIVD